MELNARMCRWPLGDPREENFSFCGSGSLAGFPYCEDHAKVAYQAAGRARTLEAKDFEDKPNKEAASEEDGVKIANR